VPIKNPKSPLSFVCRLLFTWKTLEILHFLKFNQNKKIRNKNNIARRFFLKINAIIQITTAELN
jgi:hypothetical protein